VLAIRKKFSGFSWAAIIERLSSPTNLPSVDQSGLRFRQNFLRLVICTLVVGTSCTKRPEPKPQSLPITVEANRQTLSGPVVAVADGDTITLLDSSNTQHRIRLEGIDAPESHQAFGSRSKQNLSDLIYGKEVTVISYKTDQYGRLVGKILSGGRDINLEQVRDGMAWHYKEYEREQTPTDRELYAKAEDEARAARRGLWADPDPIEPSRFRREQREERSSRRRN